MATDHPQGQGHGRRNFHRGRRGPDRRGPDRRGPAPEPQPNRGNVDVEQIMRDIRARIAQRHGIELTTQQIQDLAARRLEAILDPRSVKPALLEQLRRAAGAPPEQPPAPAEPAYTFEETTLFDSHRGLMRFVRRLLLPILKLFFNPNPLIRALNIQSRLNTEAAAREAERERRQAEWNALHYEILQRLVTENARLSIEAQALTMTIESLGAKVDFNERRVRNIEGTMHQPRGGARRDTMPDQPAVAVSAPAPVEAPAAAAEGAQPAGIAGPPGEGARRRRRRRRGRRGAGLPGEGTSAAAEGALADSDVEAADQEEAGEDDETPVLSPETMGGEADSVIVAEALAYTESQATPAPAEAPPQAQAAPERYPASEAALEPPPPAAAGRPPQD